MLVQKAAACLSLPLLTYENLSLVLFYPPKIKLSWNVILVCTRELTVRTLCVWKVLNLTEIVCLADQIFLFKCRTQCAQVVRNMNRVEKTRTSLESKNYAFAVILIFFLKWITISQSYFQKQKFFKCVVSVSLCPSRSWIAEK